MIHENQVLLNRLHVLSDGVIVFLSFPLGFWIRFHVFHGNVAVPLSSYLWVGAVYTAAQLFTYAGFGLYQSFRKIRLRRELPRVWEATLLDMVFLQSLLFLSWGVNFSRWALIAALLLMLVGLTVKRILMRGILRYFRQAGYNSKSVIVIGCGNLARRYLEKIREEKELGYRALGYIAETRDPEMGIPYLGSYPKTEAILRKQHPDEVVAAMEAEDFRRTPEVIAACERTGVRMSMIPFYADYMPAHPQFDDLNGLPLLNIRHIPLDNWANAFLKRFTDIAGSAVLLIVLSPVLLVCAIGVKLSSPGPVLFRQKRIGRDRKPFTMYKFRSMRVNDSQDTAWSQDRDDRKTKFGALLRKCSMDELPQLWNVLKGDMSLVGPRPEIPHYVDRFRDEVPLYMVKHQVRPGITGWAQVNGYRGDTSIRERIEYDVYYIEHWTYGFDIYILLITVLKGKFLNHEVV